MLAPAAAAATVPLPCGVITWKHTEGCQHTRAHTHTHAHRRTPCHGYLLWRPAHSSDWPSKSSWSLRHRSSCRDAATRCSAHTRSSSHARQWDTSYTGLKGERSNIKAVDRSQWHCCIDYSTEGNEEELFFVFFLLWIRPWALLDPCSPVFPSYIYISVKCLFSLSFCVLLPIILCPLQVSRVDRRWWGLSAPSSPGSSLTLHISFVPDILSMHPVANAGT